MVASVALNEGITDEPSTIEQAQQEKPVKALPSLEEIRREIPAECFEKNLAKSMSYFVRDVAILTGLYLIVPYVESYFGWAGLLTWYYIVGMYMFALFVVGHDCGHGTFSDHIWINDIVGHLSHGVLQVPFYPWQKSHRLHHQYTSHREKDKGHPWFTEPEFMEQHWLTQIFLTTPVYGFLSWNIAYNILGYPDGSHFWPFSKLFTSTEDRVKCAVSGAVCAGFAYAAYVICAGDWYALTKYYLIPLMFHALWLTMVTYLQHRTQEIEVYESDEWSFVKGQSQTIDRAYGFGIDHAMHHITDGHVAHHLFFTKIPHYHLMKATQTVQKILGQYPGAYKNERTYNTLYEFFRLLFRLDYLLPKTKVVSKYRSSADFRQKLQ